MSAAAHCGGAKVAQSNRELVPHPAGPFDTSARGMKGREYTLVPGPGVAKVVAPGGLGRNTPSGSAAPCYRRERKCREPHK